jgi:hypothetical protein
VYNAHFWRSNPSKWHLRRDDGEWYADASEYEPLAGSGQLTPYLTAHQHLTTYALPLAAELRDLTGGSAGDELRLAAARAANALAARVSQTEAGAEHHLACSEEKLNLLHQAPYSPWCKQSRVEAALRKLDVDSIALDEKLRTKLPQVQFDGSMQLRCWKVASTQANDFFVPGENGPPDAEERVSGINFEWSIVKKSIQRAFYDSKSGRYPLRGELHLEVWDESGEDNEDLMDEARVFPMPEPWTIGGVQFHEHFVCHAESEWIAPASGTATFYSESDDGHTLMINGVNILDNGGDHGPKVKRADYDFEAGRK